MVLRPEKEAEARAVFDKWDLDFAIVGETIPEDRFIVRLGGEVKADLPLKALSGTAPEYDRPWVPTPAPAPLGPVPAVDPAEALLTLMGEPEPLRPRLGLVAVRLPGDGGHRAAPGVRRRAWCGCTAPARASPSPRTSIRATAAPTPSGAGCRRWRRPFATSTATGARPLAATDNLNFGNPERPEIMGQLVGCIKGIARGLHGARHADRVGKRQPLQRDRGAGDPADADDRRRRADRAAGRGDPHGPARRRPAAAARRDARAPRAVGAARRGLRARGRATLRRSTCAAERAAGEFLRRRNAAGLVGAAHDLSDGGLAVAAAEMALAGGHRGRGRGR